MRLAASIIWNDAEVRREASRVAFVRRVAKETTPLEALEHLARWRDVLGETKNDNPDAAEKA